MKLFSAILILLFIYAPCAFSGDTNNDVMQDEMNTFLKEKDDSRNQFNKEMKGIKKTDPVVNKKSSNNQFKHSVSSQKNVPVISKEAVPEPVAEYLFSGNGADTSGNNNNAIVSNALLTPDRGGNENSAYIFYERNHRIEIPRTPSNTFSSGSFTASFWIKTKDDGSGLKGILTNKAGSSTLWGFNYTSQGKIHFYLRNQDGQSAFIVYPIGDGNWHHVTGVRNSDNNTMSLYMDGRLIETRPGVTGSLDSGTSIWVGDHQNLLFVGRIDDIRLWNEALNDDALETMHAKNIGSPVLGTKPLQVISVGTPEPVAKYMFDGNAEDSSGNNNHGIVNGAELIQDRAGKKDSAFLFYERPHRIKIPLTQSNTFTNGSFTASFWVKTMDESSTSRGLLTNDANKTPLWGFNYTSAGTVQFIIRNQEGDSSGITHPINDGKWHHVTGTRNTYNNTMSLYIDSTLVQTRRAVTGSVNSLSDIWIGDHKNRLFIGRIDDVMLWDKPFTEKQLETFHAESAASLTQVAVSSPDEDTRPDPVGNYLFNGDATDSSSEGNDGIVNAAHLSTDRFGNENSSYCFSERNNRIKIPLIPANTFSQNSFSISFWFKINESTSGMHGLVTNSKNTLPVWSFSYSDAGKIYFKVRNKENQSSGIMYPITDENWHHVTGIRNASNNTISLYIDSRHVETKPGVEGDVNSGNSIWIGEHTNQLFRGCIDDVVLWRKAFSAREMIEIEMNAANVRHLDPTKNNKMIKKLNKKHTLPKY